MNNKKIDEILLFPLLFSRLNWPSLLVQERAANSIATLLVDKRYTSIMTDLLLDWIKSQKLESIVVKAILILLRAQILDPSFQGPSMTELLQVFYKPSLLSWLLFSAYDTHNNIPLDASVDHSGKAPENFIPDPFFEKYITRFIPPIYDWWADKIEKKEKFQFHRQWAFEWNTIVNLMGITPTIHPLDNFWGINQLDSHYLAIDTEMGEVYRSAYLRTLAYAFQNGQLSGENALFFAVQTCPIDLELWKLLPQKRPLWWPQEVVIVHQTESAIGKIWNQVENLWIKNQPSEGDDGEEWIIGEATGFIQHDKSIYELEIYGAFQRCDGPKKPELEEIISFISGAENRNGRSNLISIDFQSPLFFKGEIEFRPKDMLIERFDDWTILPACGYARPTTVPRWQSWRMYRKIWLPVFGSENQYFSFSVEKNSVEIRNQNQIISKWNDWTDGINEKVIDGVPIRTGQYCMLSKSNVREFCQDTNSSFCWLCKLNVYSKDKSYNYKSMNDYRAFGTSLIIKV